MTAMTGASPATGMPPGVLALRAWKPHVPGVREVLHAAFGAHVYPLHTHDTWTLFIVDEGAIQYDLGRREGRARPSMVSVLPPHVVHDGRPGAPGGYRKRVVYLEMDLIGEALIGRAADRPVLPDPGLRARVVALHEALECIDDAFEAEVRLNAIAEQIRSSLGGPAPNGPTTSDPSDRPLAQRLRAELDAHLFERLTMASAANAVGVDPTRLARAFARTFGIAPHAYVTGRRIDAARDRILGGRPLADVAAEVGFADQAHLTRRFTAFLGVTPGRYQREATPRLWSLDARSISGRRGRTAGC
jgi:AraC-like DNA-binding protein